MLCAPLPGTTIRAPMTTDRSAALALTAGSLAGLVIMALHPTGGDIARDPSGGALRLAKAVHWVAIVAQPLVLAGTLAITLRLRTRRDLAVGAFISFAVASICVILAATASGIVSTGVLEGMHDPGAGDMTSVESFGHYTFLWNQAFASIYVVLGGIAIALWSAAILSCREPPRALGVYGVAFGAALVAGIASGHLTLGVHGFGLVILGQGAWMIWAAVALWRGERPAPDR
jgi:uncharacterized membrane protein